MLKYINSNSQPFKRLTIQIVSPAEFTVPLKDALTLVNTQKYQNKLQFAFCENIEQNISRCDENNFSPDYIVLVLDPQKKECIAFVEDNIRMVDPLYINGSRICIVNGGCSTKFIEMGVGFGHINILVQKYSAILINGDVLIPEKCMHLASRITGLVTSVCGFLTGVPVIVDVPGYDDLLA